MGLDMYLQKLNKKMTQKELDDMMKIRREFLDLKEDKEFVEKVKEYKNIRTYVIKHYENVIEDFNDYLKGVSKFNRSLYFNDFEKSFADFDNEESLIDYIETEFKKNIFKLKTSISKRELDKDFMKKAEAIENLNLDFEDIAYWRKHADLNQYFAELAEERIECDEFNCEYLVLSKLDIETLYDKITNYLNGCEEEFDVGHGFFWGQTTDDQWKESKEIFKKVLDTFDFDNNTLIYYCWY